MASSQRAADPVRNGVRAPRARLVVLRALGLVFFAAGAIGIVVPLLPTTILWILAALCWADSHPAWRERLFASKRFGPGLRDWFDEGAIGRRGKAFALCGIAAGWVFAVWALGVGPRVALALAVLLAAIAAWIATRPAPRREAAGREAARPR